MVYHSLFYSIMNYDYGIILCGAPPIVKKFWRHKTEQTELLWELSIGTLVWTC
jgi:hypothetical protein